MFIYLFEDGGLVYSKDEPTELDLHGALEGNTTIIRLGTNPPQEYTMDDTWEDIPEAKLIHYEGNPFHGDSYDDYEDEEENE